MRRAYIPLALTLVAVPQAWLACGGFESGNEKPQVDAGSDVATPVVDSSSQTDAVPNDAGLPEADSGASDADATAPSFGLVFLTSTPHVGQFPPVDGGSALDGLSGADDFCRSLADKSSEPAVRGRMWTAYLSWKADQSGAARLRLPLEANGNFRYRYVLVDQITEVFPKGFNFDVVVDGGASLPTNPIAMTENKQVFASKTVWTGTLNNGQPVNTTQCGGWNLADPSLGSGGLGNSNVLTVWSYSGDLGSAPCNQSHHLYCFEKLP